MRFMQSKLTNQRAPDFLEQTTGKFSDFMITGKVVAALRLFPEIKSPGILPTKNETIDHLKNKNPDGATKFQD